MFWSENDGEGCDNADEITCPWCGYEFADSWEYAEDSGIKRCHECERLFEYQRNVNVTYTTEIL